MNDRAKLNAAIATRELDSTRISAAHQKVVDLRSRGSGTELLAIAELAECEIPALEKALAESERVVIDAALVTFRAERDAALREVLASVETLGLSLAQLLATEIARNAVTGARFTFDPGRHPPFDLWQPGPVVAALVAAMPSRLTPDGWASGIERGAQAISNRLLNLEGLPE